MFSRPGTRDHRGSYITSWWIEEETNSLQHVGIEEKCLKTGCQAPGTPPGFGCGQGLRSEQGSSTARDMTGMRAHLNHRGSLSTRVQDLSISVLSKTSLLTEHTVHLCGYSQPLSSLLYFFFFSHLPGVVASKSKIIKQAKSHIKEIQITHQ